MATLKSNIPALVKRMRSRASRLVRATAAGIEADIKADMAGPKSGRVYGAHVASAPGQSPAIDEGTYANSIRVVDVDETTSTVGTSDERGPLLELGGGRTAARPHFTPAFGRAEEGFREGMKKIFEA